MGNLITLWNWPKTTIQSADIEVGSKICRFSSKNTLCVVSNNTESISEWNYSEIDALTFSRPVISDPSESSIFKYGVRLIPPSPKETSYILENNIFCDRIIKNVWSKDIVKRFWIALSHAKSKGDSYLVFISNGIHPVSENFDSEFHAIIEKEIAKEIDFMIFRDINSMIFKNLFLIKTSFLESVFGQLQFKNDEFEKQFTNIDPEGFLELCYRKSNSVSVLSSDLILKIFAWHPHDFDFDIGNIQIDPRERIASLKSICLNSIFLSRNSRGNFDLSHVFCNLCPESAFFSASIVMVRGHDRDFVHREEMDLPYRDWRAWSEIMEIVPNSDSYLEITLRTNYLDLIHSEFYVLPLKFEDLYNFSSLKYYYKKNEIQ
jgi:hypothetical protein